LDSRSSWTSFLGAGHGFAYLTLALIAKTDFGQFVNASPREVVILMPRPDASALEELYAFDALPDLDTLADAQGITPVTDFEDLLGDSWPEGESVEDFIAAATEGRREETPEP
jgi:hypothetical protein